MALNQYGHCNYQACIPKLLELVRTRVTDPVRVLTEAQPVTDTTEVHEHFDRREAGWIKTEKPAKAE